MRRKGQLKWVVGGGRERERVLCSPCPSCACHGIVYRISNPLILICSSFNKKHQVSHPDCASQSREPPLVRRLRPNWK